MLEEILFLAKSGVAGEEVIAGDFYVHANIGYLAVHQSSVNLVRLIKDQT